MGCGRDLAYWKFLLVSEVGVVLISALWAIQAFTTGMLDVAIRGLLITIIFSIGIALHLRLSKGESKEAFQLLRQDKHGWLISSIISITVVVILFRKLHLNALFDPAMPEHFYNPTRGVVLTFGAWLFFLIIVYAFKIAAAKLWMKYRW